MQEFPTHYKIALKAAVSAAEQIMRVYLKPLETTIKPDGSPVTNADLAASKIISEILAETNIPIIGEELIHLDFEIRKTWQQVWIVDPLDGTKEFIDKNGEFAVNIAFVEDGKPVFGIVASPVKRTVLFGGIETGVFYIDFEEIELQSTWKQLTTQKLNSPIILAGSRSHHTSEVMDLIDTLNLKFGKVEFVLKGSSLKFFDLALGTADVYPRFAPTMEWDIASGQAILNGLGGEVLDAESNQPLTYNKEDLYNPNFIAKTKAYIDAED